ncbi:acetate uptake transporter [Bacillus benzoevorans]|nr:acetate uptake transporter [Bacillus benzoevorans]
MKAVSVNAKIVMSDATALGIFGLAMVTLVASSQKLGWTEGTAYIIPWAIILGSLAQIWASLVDFKNNNYFGAIALGVYGLFWSGVAFHWAIGLGWFGDLGPVSDPRQLAFAFLGYLIFSLFITVAAMEVNKVLFAILLLIDVLFISLALATFDINHDLFAKIGAYSEFAIALLGFYACGAIFLNGFFGRTILSLGKPLGIIKKG